MARKNEAEWILAFSFLPLAIGSEPLGKTVNIENPGIKSQKPKTVSPHNFPVSPIYQCLHNFHHMGRNFLLL
jgi:hypothetical protein